MTFLPIVERELRVLARRRTTYWTRLLAAGLAFVIFAGIMVISELGRRPFGNQLGTFLFGIFSFLSFLFVCSAGVFLTSDCLSEEKRDGTLGLLFLTDLRGYDVVLGKLFSNSLVAFYGLLAAFPVIGIAFLLGGVTGAEFWRMALALCNALFFSLAAGVLISAISRDTQKAMGGTALLCLLFVVGLPVVDWAMAGRNSAKSEAWFSLASPSLAFGQAQSKGLGNFWTSLAVTHVIGWAFLALACFIAPRSWQESSSKASAGESKLGGRLWFFNSPARRDAFRKRWLADNPIRWLAARDRWLAQSQWLVGLGAVLVVVVFWLFDLLIQSTGGAAGDVVFGIAYGAYFLLTALLNLWLASQASRFFVDATRNGALELLLATPLRPEQIVRGQLWSLRRAFLLPAILVLVLGAAVSAWQIMKFTGIRAGVGAINPYPTDFMIQQITAAVGSLATLVTGLLAVAWFGMWMGLTSKKPTAAVSKTLVFVQILPWLLFLFVQGMLMFVVFAAMSGSMGIWLPQLLVTLLSVGVDVAFILVARKKLLTSFREIVARETSGSVIRKPSAPPALPAETPPVITA